MSDNTHNGIFRVNANGTVEEYGNNGGGGGGITVVDNLNSTSGTDALSANQGRVLNGNIGTINSELGNQTYGLQAIKDAVDDANDELTDSSHGLSALDTLMRYVGGVVEDILDQVANGTISTNLRYIVGEILSAINNNSTGLSAIKTAVDDANSALGNSTNGLGAIKAAVDAIGSGGSSVIKSIQRGIFNAPAKYSTAPYTQNITISEVDPSKSIVIINVGGTLTWNTGNGFTASSNAAGILTSGTVLQINYAIENSYTAEIYGRIYWQVIEFN